MLTTLRIKNLALVTDLTVELQPGCNVITGETGAGKSIIIGALNLVLGERADRTLIRSGEDSCAVEAVIDVSKLRAPLKSFLEENGLEPCESEQLVLKRTFSVSGTNRQFINGSPATLNMLAAVGRWLVDIHGPHDHQSLLHPAKQLALLDAFGRLEEERRVFRNLLERQKALHAEKAELIVDEKSYAQQLDLLRFQVNEITTARLLPYKDAQLEQVQNRASNTAKLLQLSQAALDALSENESSLLSQAGVVGRVLLELQRVDAGAAKLTELHGQGVEALRELQAALSTYADKVDIDPQRLQESEDRLNLIHSLKRKYGASLADVITFGEEAKGKLQNLEQRDVELARIASALGKVDADLQQAGDVLSTKRRKAIAPLSKAVSKQLAALGFKQSEFAITISTAQGEINSQAVIETGFDTIEFQFAPNPGEPARPLRAIASSGEMARVMLALKTALAAEDDIPVLVFDEVDANVGGETAKAVGEKMKEIATRRQVLCITHLPQVAAPADAHYVVTKVQRNGRTISEIKLLGQTDRVEELARMLGGQSEAARKHAEALLK